MVSKQADGDRPEDSAATDEYQPVRTPDTPVPPTTPPIPLMPEGATQSGAVKQPAVITRLLARMPEHRYQSCDELIEDLQWHRLDSPALSFFASGDRSGE
jgi:hypothetical protein